MKRILIIAFVAVLLAGGWAVVRIGRQPAPNAPAAAAAEPPRESTVVGPGRIEPASEEVRVGAELEGRLQEVRVEEGARVHQGDIVAVIENQDYRARVSLAEADVASREAELQRVIAGARAEERQEAASAVKEAEAALANARAELKRYETLYAEHLTAREQVEVRRTTVAQDEARLEAARHHQDLVDAAARQEDRSRAEAQVELARSRLEETRSLLAKTTIRAPIAGVVLRRHFRTGETVAAGEPIVTLGDLTRLRVRMELDERDIARVHVGQEAWCTADAYGTRRFSGRVSRIGQMLGRKNIRTDDPAERVDTKVLEALIDLEAGTVLPPGLRVDVYLK